MRWTCVVLNGTMEDKTMDHGTKCTRFTEYHEGMVQKNKIYVPGTYFIFRLQRRTTT